MTLTNALAQFASQSGLQVVYRTELTERMQSQGAEAGLSAEAALQQLLRDTGLRYEFINERTVAIRSAKAEAEERKRVSQLESGALADQGNAFRLAQHEVGETAQEPQTASDSGDVQEVLVSGKPFMDRNVDIVRTVDDAQPYYILDHETLVRSGVGTVEDYLKQRLTMNAMPLSNNQYATFGQGNISSINLRGIGANQTLILINGRRTSVSNFTGTTNQPDVNAIPLSAIDRIEVLPASSAAIYGGSAVGGVINIVLKKDYRGLELKANYENTFDGDAPIRRFDLAYGFKLEGGRTNVMLTGNYSEADALRREDRPQIVAKGISTILRNYPALLYSNTSPFNAGATTNIASSNGSNLTLLDGTSLGSPFTHVPASITPTTADGVLGAGLLANAGTYNLALPDTANYYTGGRFFMGSAPQVKSFQASVRRQMTDDIEAFIEFSNGTNEAESIFNSLFTLPVPSTSPVNPFQQNLTITIPDPYAAPYRASIESRRFTVGMTTDLPHEWRGQADYTWNYTNVMFASTNTNAARLNAALASGEFNPFVNTVLYPLNLNPYRGDYEYNAPAELNDVGVRVSGPLWQMPAGAPVLSVGLEHRKEGFLQGNQWFHYAGYPQDDSYRLILNQDQKTDSIYAELKLPFVSAANSMPGVRELDVQIAARTEKYSVTTGPVQRYLTGTPAQLASNPPPGETEVDYTSTNPTIAIRYRPIDSLMFRASYGTAFLAPGYTQLAAPIDNPNAAATVLDPRRGNALTNVRPISGGNPDIQPQESKNWNVGLVFEPQSLEGRLRLSLEWFRLEQENVVVTPTPQQMVDLESQFPNRITRAAPAPGETIGAITVVNATLINANRGDTEGFDATAQYRVPTDSWGTFTFFAMGTLVDGYRIQTSVVAPLEDIVNELGRGGPLKFKANAMVGWERGPWSAGWAMRYFGSYKQYDFGTQAYLLAQGHDHIPSQSYHDVFASYRFDQAAAGSGRSRLLEGLEVQLGIKNAFDKVPPFDAYYGVQGYYYSPLGDPRLRSYWVALKKAF